VLRLTAGLAVTLILSPLIGFSASPAMDPSEQILNFANTWTRSSAIITVKVWCRPSPNPHATCSEQTFSPRGLLYFSRWPDKLTPVPAFTITALETTLQLSARRSGSGGTRSGPFSRTIEHGNSSPRAGTNGWSLPILMRILEVRWEFYSASYACLPKGGFFKLQTPSNNTLCRQGLCSNPDNMGIVSKLQVLCASPGLAYRLRNPRSSVLDRDSSRHFPRQQLAYIFPVRANNSFNPAVAGYGPAVLQRTTSRLLKLVSPAVFNL